MENCLFCKIIRGEIPVAKLYEDEHTLAFLDIMPAAKGHALVIPKHHGKTLLDIPSEELCHTIKIVQKIAAATVKATGAEGFNIHQSNSEAAGQVIPHVHFHIIPRKGKDGLTFENKRNEGKKTELEKMQEKIRKEM